jgi:hypothetical protein
MDFSNLEIFKGYRGDYGPDGWCDIIEHLVQNINQYLGEEKQKKFKVTQIKEKFAGLRFYYYAELDEADRNEIDLFINLAEWESEQTCQVCGALGQQSTKGYWIRTVCDQHDN